MHTSHLIKLQTVINLTIYACKPNHGQESSNMKTGTYMNMHKTALFKLYYKYNCFKIHFAGYPVALKSFECDFTPLDAISDNNNNTTFV